MPSAGLLEKLDPDRYPNMSMTFAAILGYVCGEQWTQPVILDIDVVEDVMLATSDGQFLPNLLGKVSDVLPDLRTTKGLTVEKIEGFAVLANGDALLVNDNDGVDENNGETWLFNLGKLNLN